MFWSLDMCAEECWGHHQECHGNTETVGATRTNDGH